MTPEDKTQFQSPSDRQRAMELSKQRTQPPTTVPGYEPLRFLGSGAYGEVWVAIDKNTGRQVAIKFFEHRGGVDWSLLSREVEKLVFLSADRYVVQLLDVGWDADPPYYVMEYVENGSLDDRLRAFGTISVSEAVAIFREVAIGLSHAHAKGVLHCDIKPANILLDQDQKPRLADFGQSRLTTEQNPALGTLFYMAPEQADLESVPDAQWDVYALGSLLYCMLTGQPPHRDREALDEIDSAISLPDRLAAYRAHIQDAPASVAHRQVRGVDRRLVEIIDRCLAVKPRDRYPHVLSVLEDLDKRDEVLAHRPFQLLGILLPLLLMLTMGLFGYRAFERAIEDSQTKYIQRTRESNRFAAEGEARNVSNELDKRFRAIETAAEALELSAIVKELTTDDEISMYLSLLGARDLPASEREGLKFQFDRSGKRADLQQHLQQLMTDPRLPPVASWFITDTRGTMLAAEFDQEPNDRVIGDNFSYRTYFHGHGDLPDDATNVQSHEPLSETLLSTPFKSTATQTYKVAISCPVRDDVDKVVGVMVMTFELGQFVEFPTSVDLCAVLVDGRDNEFRGMIIQHPLYDSLLQRFQELPKEIGISDPAYRADVDVLRSQTGPRQSTAADGSLAARSPAFYHDPLSQNALGAEYADPWIVAAAPVTFKRARGLEQVEFDTGLLLLVQRRLSSAVEPVRDLAGLLLREAITAIIVVSILSVALWYFVRRMLGDTLGRTQRGAGNGDESTSISQRSASVHTRETLDMPSEKSAVTPGGSRSETQR